MFKFTRLRLLIAIGLFSTATIAASTASAGDFDALGYTDLVERLGEKAVPTGESVGVAQVEGPVDGDYSPDQDSSHFKSKTFTEMSGPTGVSSHAQNVAVGMYSDTASMAFGVEDVWLYDANDWLTAGFLRTSAPVPPLTPPEPIRLFNNSWIGSVSGFDNEVLRRADWATDSFDVLIVSGVANSGGSGSPLMSHSFNGVAVGTTSGGHASGSTADGFDGPGRQKPEITAPTGSTSSATPRVSAAATLLFDTAQTDPGLMSNPDADQPDVIKAALLAGATHSDEHGEPWTNDPIDSGPERGIADQPLDDIVGAGTVNINISHLILTGGQQVGAPTVPDTSNADLNGWDRAAMDSDDSRYWRFDIADDAEQASFLITWNRIVPSNFNEYALAHLELELWSVDESGTLSSLVGDAGLDVFVSGNVVSQSEVDNIQHLYIQDLAAGEYVLEARRIDDMTDFTDWPVAAAWHIDAEVPKLIGDLNGDGQVGGADLGMLLSEWGECLDPDDCPADLNEDGTVNGADLGLLLSNWTG